VGLIFAASATLRRALERLARSLAAWQDSTAIRVEATADTLVWTYRIAATETGPHRQDRDYTRPSFGQAANRLIFDRAAAERVQLAEDEGLMAVLSRHVEDLLRPPAPGDLVARVRGLIALHLGQRAVTLALIATELNLSTRSLQRKLGEAGTALRPLLLQARLETAREHLREGRISNAEIARRLGYADGTGLWRAVKGAAPALKPPYIGRLFGRTRLEIAGENGESCI
jgi:AraC-like DNA-binding protein